MELTDASEIIKKIRFKINVAQTRYPIVKKVAATICNWRLKEFSEDCDGAVGKAKQLSLAYDLTWHDSQVSAEFFQRLQPYQKVNMYPGISCITKKHHLAKGLMRMNKFFPQEYNFFPKTWRLPEQSTAFRSHYAVQIMNSQRRRGPWYICKPDSLAQGRGIFLSRDIDHIFEKT